MQSLGWNLVSSLSDARLFVSYQGNSLPLLGLPGCNRCWKPYSTKSWPRTHEAPSPRQEFAASLCALLKFSFKLMECLAMSNINQLDLSMSWIGESSPKLVSIPDASGASHRTGSGASVGRQRNSSVKVENSTGTDVGKLESVSELHEDRKILILWNFYGSDWWARFSCVHFKTPKVQHADSRCCTQPWCISVSKSHRRIACLLWQEQPEKLRSVASS